MHHAMYNFLFDQTFDKYCLMWSGCTVYKSTKVVTFRVLLMLRHSHTIGVKAKM